MYSVIMVSFYSLCCHIIVHRHELVRRSTTLYVFRGCNAIKGVIISIITNERLALPISVKNKQLIGPVPCVRERER